MPHVNFLKKAGSAGVVITTWELRIVADDGRDVEAGKPGEIWVRGPAVMKVRFYAFYHVLGNGSSFIA
jgi:acyl-CoA synthetase (AMP-forming)/AMP-acid ligase II